jgi:hypothetical protein
MLLPTHTNLWCSRSACLTGTLKCEYWVRSPLSSLLSLKVSRTTRDVLLGV